MRKIVMALAVLCMVVAQDVRGQDAPPVRVSLSGRLQVQWNSTSVDELEAGTDAPIAGSTFELRRVRLQAGIRVHDWIEGVLEPDFAGSRLALKQAWVGLEFDPAFVVRAGQFKKPFSLILLSSSTQLAPIERGVRIRELDDALEVDDAAFGGIIGEEQALLEAMNYHGYDIGAAVEGEKAGFGWSVGVFNGNGADARDTNDAKTVAGRVTYELPVSTPLRLGVAVSRRDMVTARAGESQTETGTAYSVDAELGGFRRGVWLVAEAVRGTNLFTDETFTGAQAMLSWFHGAGSGRRVEGIEPVARVSYGDPDDTVDGDEGVLLTPGVNLYLFGRNRLMFNWDVFLPRGDAYSAQHAARAQLNLHF